ncbi:MAG TPA: hypothetical protein VF834_20885 [Streptosporangiaceae bacterium]
MQSRLFFPRSGSTLIAASVLAVGGLCMAASPSAARPAGHGIVPNKVNNLDCNGWSRKYTALVPEHRILCVDPHGPLRAPRHYSSSRAGRAVKHWTRFIDNGHYIGHDEPSVKFISGTPNSANTMTYFMTMPTDPAMRPTNSGSVVKYAELSPAPWFGLPLCDPRSYPQNPCTPDSDTNSGVISDPNAAGSAFMELQFYPPGFPPFADSVSCSQTLWCAAITIDSLESQFNFANLNPNCTEPVNFAFLSRNGKPAGPPSPQLASARTFLPNRNTLMIRSGDVLKVAITDPSQGFTTTVTDLTTHQKGWITASAGNGFMNTDFQTCQGFRHTFHAEYNTAAQQNQVPWAALEGGVLMQQEMGHSEVCGALIHRNPLVQPTVTDRNVFDTCVGGSEGGRRTVGEGSCSARTGVCQHPMTQGTSGPIACPSKNFAGGQLCEFADGVCLPQGTRTVSFGQRQMKETSPVNFCQAGRFQNGDLDFDGLPYQRTTWPNGSPNVPTSFRYAGPFDAAGQSYPQIQFETDVPGSEFLCDVFTGNLCTAPPVSAPFYPFWTLTSKKGQNVGHGLFPTGACVWNFGNTISGVTTRNLGRDAQYGAPDLARFGGTTISPVRNNPEIEPGHGCPVLRAPH